MKDRHCVDAYIEERNIPRPDNYKMYLSYDGVEFCYLHEDKNNSAAKFAANFSKRMHCETDRMNYTDFYGLLTDKDNNNSVLASVTNLANIDKAIIGLMFACMEYDIQADLTVHLHDKEYPIIRTVDGEYYRNADRNNIKGYNTEIWDELANTIEELKTVPYKILKRRKKEDK